MVKGRRFDAFRRYLAWQLKVHMNDEVETDWILGIRAVVGKRTRGFNGNIYVGLIEYREMALLIHLLRQGDLFVDVGAYLGSYTMLASAVCGARVLAFEGASETAELLSRNLRLNGLEELVDLHRAAVGDGSGEVDFRVGQDTWNRTSLPGESSRRVRQVRLDDIIGEAVPSMLKIDTNWTSERVLAGADKTLRNPSLVVVRCEDQYDNVVSRLQSFGFERAIYDPAHRILTQIPSDDPRYYPLFVRDFDAVRERIAAAPKRQIMGRWL